MWDFIAKYWLEALFGIIIAVLTGIVKHYFKLIKDSQTRHEQDIINTMTSKMDEQKKEQDARFETQKTEMQQQMGSCYANIISVIDKRDQKLLDEDKNIREDIKNLGSEFDSVKSGMLTVQGRAFKEECHRLLEPNHNITLTEYENILSEHATYNALGGNHEGDALFAMVETKFQKDLGR